MGMNEASESSGMLTSESADRWRTSVSVIEDAMCQVLDRKSAKEFSLVLRARDAQSLSNGSEDH